MKQTRAIVYETFGNPLEVLKLVEREVPEPGVGEVQIKLLAAPLHPSDFGMIGGSYGKLKELPATAGREGVGEIISMGEGVENVCVGDWVGMPPELGTWQELVTAKADKLFKIPKSVPVEMAAMVTINPPTAWRLLRDGNLNHGEWVIQNAANSAVGIHLIQMAQHLGLKTINVVRREELIEPLKKCGADVVVLEDSGYEKKIKELTGGGYVGLALNSVGGESAVRLIKSLSNGGKHVTFGAMAFEAIRFPTRYLIFNDIKLEGFWMDKWYRDNSEARAQIMFDKLFHLMQQGAVSPLIEKTFSLENFAEAIEVAQQPRLGKVLFTA